MFRRLQRRRLEDVEVDAARPQHDVREADRLEVALDHDGRRHDGFRRPVEPAEKRVGPRQRHAGARLDVFGKARVIRGRERDVPAQCESSGGEPERAFRRDVDGVGIELGKSARELPARQDRQPDVGVGRAGQRAELQRRDHLHRVTQQLQFARGVLQRPHDTVDLRLPGVRHQCDVHAATPATAGSSSAMRPRFSGSSRRPRHSMSCNLPSNVSASAVMLSTQSPSLQ